ncbi:MAG: DMT family transporter [Candidatus Hydrogenedentes bacterium]|nr:DMT family transporter [Candidatus Hydrogenedentota bacterium]
MLLHAVVLVFGFTGILGKLISVGSAPLVWYRLLIAVVAIAMYLLWARVPLRLPREGVRSTLLVGLIVAAHWTCFFESIKQSTVSIALVCLSTGTLFTSLIEPVVFRRGLRLYEMLLGVFTVFGILFVFRFESGYTVGIAYGLVASFLGAVFTVINGKLVGQYDSRSISLYELASGFGGLSVYLLFVARPGWDVMAVSRSDLAYLLVLGVVCTGFAFVGSVHVMRALSPFTVVLTINLEPIYGIVLALLVFGESEYMTPGFYAGAAVILLSIWVNAIVKRSAAGG